MNDTEASTETQSRRFAKRVLDSIRAAGRTTDADVAAVGGPSDSYMTTLRKAAAGEVLLPEPRGHTQKRIEQAAGWMPGSVLKVWNGDEPTVAARMPRDLQPGDTWREAVATSAGPSDQELMQTLWALLDERGAIDMFVSNALMAVERRLGEVRAERNRLAHGAPTQNTTVTPLRPSGKIVTLTESEMEAVLQRALLELGYAREGAEEETREAEDLDAMPDATLAARRGLSEGRALRAAQDAAGEDNQDPDA